jgi:hypothetical protein
MHLGGNHMCFCPSYGLGLAVFLNLKMFVYKIGLGHYGGENCTMWYIEWCSNIGVCSKSVRQLNNWVLLWPLTSNIFVLYGLP